MAMIRCTECRKDVSDKATTCPHCGAPVDVAAARAIQASNGRRTLKLVGGGIALLILLRMCSSMGSSSKDDLSSNASASTQPSAAVSQAPTQDTLKVWMTDLIDENAPAGRREAYAKNIIQNFPNTPEAAKAQELLPQLTEAKTNADWYYDNEEDGMSGKRIGYAAVRSDNTLSLDFPYQGAQHGKLAVRHHPKWGKSVIVSIEEGQILCSSYECPVRIRFDDGQPVTYTGNEPSDNSTETVFLPYSVAKKLQTAKRVKVEINLYQNGAQVLEFNVKGFNPERMKAPATQS